MAKFSGRIKTPMPRAALTTINQRARTFEGGQGWVADPETELFLLAATMMAGEGSFYEPAEVRDVRFVQLVHRLTATNPAFVAGLAAYLRTELKIRSASIMLAAEYVAAGGEGGRAVVNSVLQRGDEPAEMVAYWLGRYGRSMKMAVKRGVADAVQRLYTERAALRYDGQSRAVRMADVIELTHPKARDQRQAALYRWLLDSRHHGDAKADPDVLPMLAAAEAVEAVPPDERRDYLRVHGAEALARAGVSWERLSGWVPGGMDAEAWEAVLPSMGVMALISNLRNFDEQAISAEAVDTVISRITDPVEVERARLFPYQVWAAYKNAPSDNWKRALGITLELTTSNVPVLDRTLVLIDMSGSMQAPVSARSKVTRVEVAAVMAAVTATKGADVNVAIFGATNRAVRIRRGASVLGVVNDLVAMIGHVGHATYGHTAIAHQYNRRRHDRVVMFTDDQQHDSGRVDLRKVPLIYTVDLGGYAIRSLRTGEAGRYALAGFSDATFTLMRTLEDGRDAGWPF
ncbi:MAG: TROVE domain-containing protein [Acidimicrobiales bacterium]